MHDSDIATAADYADAMLTARRAKNVLVLLLMLVIIGQLAVFFLVRYDVVPLKQLLAAPTTEPAMATTAEAATTGPVAVAPARDYSDVMNYISGACLAIGLIGTIILGFVLLIIVNIMLVGRLIGVARLTSAYLWCIVLLVLLFPWQAFLNNVGLTPDRIAWKLPGVLYTWNELMLPNHGAKFPEKLDQFSILKWVRYVAFPLAALIMLLVIQFKSNKGMRQALGEEEAIPAEG